MLMAHKGKESGNKVRMREAPPRIFAYVSKWERPIEEEPPLNLWGGASQTTGTKMDFDAAVRILRAFIRDMTGSSELHKDKLLRKPIGIGDVLEAIRSFPESRLDDATPTGITVRELLERVSHFSRCDSVKKAVGEKLNH